MTLLTYFKLKCALVGRTLWALCHYRKTRYYALKDHPLALYRLAQLYETGTLIVKADMAIAYTLYHRAAYIGYDSAKQRIAQLDAMLPVELLNQAKRITLKQLSL